MPGALVVDAGDGLTVTTQKLNGFQGLAFTNNATMTGVSLFGTEFSGGPPPRFVNSGTIFSGAITSLSYLHSPGTIAISPTGGTIALGAFVGAVCEEYFLDLGHRSMFLLCSCLTRPPPQLPPPSPAASAAC